MLYNNNLLLESFKYYSKIIPIKNLSVFNNELRIRATYKTKQSDSLELSLHLELLRILKDFSARAKKVDPECDILVWNSCKEEDYVADNASKLALFTAAKFVGMPMNGRVLGSIKNRMGFRISSKLTMYQFIDK